VSAEIDVTPLSTAPPHSEVSVKAATTLEGEILNPERKTDTKAPPAFDIEGVIKKALTTAGLLSR